MGRREIEIRLNSILQNAIFEHIFRIGMLTSCKGFFENGRIELSEDAPVKVRTEVIVTFLHSDTPVEKKKRVPGGLKGKIGVLPDDFNNPLDDLNEYM
jgi:hypothetical protein